METDVPFDFIIIDLAMNLLLTEKSYEWLPSCCWQVEELLKVEQQFQLLINFLWVNEVILVEDETYL